MSGTDDLFPGFVSREFETGRVRLHARVGGSGPPLLLLHGYPQTHVCWHKVAGPLARRHTVIAADLRGYGQSACPATDLQSRAYSKRVMADDMILLMHGLGFRRFAVMAHNRGACVAYRMALDWPEDVARLVLLDIVTTWDFWRTLQTIAQHRGENWAFLAQPAPIPESLIGADPTAWLESCLRRATASHSLDPFDARALAAYRAMLSQSDHVHATCEDFRAGAGCDLSDDRADRSGGRRIPCQTLLVWGKNGLLAGLADPVALWRPWCRSVSGVMLDCGHYLPEEQPQGLLDAVLPFLSNAESADE